MYNTEVNHRGGKPIAGTTPRATRGTNRTPGGAKRFHVGASMWIFPHRGEEFGAGVRRSRGRYRQRRWPGRECIKPSGKTPKTVAKPVISVDPSQGDKNREGRSSIFWQILSTKRLLCLAGQKERSRFLLQPPALFRFRCKK